MKQIGINLRGAGSSAAAQEIQARRRLSMSCQSPSNVVLWDGGEYPVATRSASLREHEDLPDGGGNAADVDLRIFNFTPPGLPGGLPRLMQSDETFTWMGDGYTALTDAKSEDLGVAVRVIAYRTPPKGSDSLDPGTGKRPDYLPPDTTL